MERYYDVLFVHVLLSWFMVSVFRHVLLWWWQVIVLSFRWCCIPDLHRHCYTHTVLIILDNDLIITWWFLLRRSWILNTWVITYTDDYVERCLDAVMMISTTTADYGLYIPDLSTTPIIATRCRGDVLVDVATDVVFLRCSARRRRCRRGADLLCLCASPASCWWISTTPMMGLSSPAPNALWAR